VQTMLSLVWNEKRDNTIGRAVYGEPGLIAAGSIAAGQRLGCGQQDEDLIAARRAGFADGCLVHEHARQHPDSEWAAVAEVDVSGGVHGYVWGSFNPLLMSVVRVCVTAFQRTTSLGLPSVM